MHGELSRQKGLQITADLKHAQHCMTAQQLLTAWHKASRSLGSISKQGSKFEYSGLERYLHAAEHGVEELANDKGGQEVEENIYPLHSRVTPSFVA